MSTTGSTPQSPRHLRVFIASPGDVADERALALEVLERLQCDPMLRDKITLEVMTWDHPDFKSSILMGVSAESEIRSLGKPSECDIVVVILWSLLGSPIEQKQYMKPDGSGYFSGTEWAYEDALQAYRKDGKPLMLFYYRRNYPHVELNPIDRKHILNRLDQIKSVATFLKACNQQEGLYPYEYETPSEFKRMLQRALKEVIFYLLELQGQPIQYYSCFISYSSKDEDFAQHLHADLQHKRVRCWFAPKDIRGGRKLYEQIDEAIQRRDKLLLVLSEHSMNSEWVKTEIIKALGRQVDEKRRVLFPIRLVDFKTIQQWKYFDSDIGKDLAKEIREYFIPDFL